MIHPYTSRYTSSVTQQKTDSASQALKPSDSEGKRDSLHETQTLTHENSIFSNQAKQKYLDDAPMLSYIRKVQSLPEDSSRSHRVEELKKQFSTPQGLQNYLESIDASHIAGNLVEHKIF